MIIYEGLYYILHITQEKGVISLRIVTLLNFIVTLLSFGLYFFIIDPYLQHNRWIAFLIFFTICMTLHYSTRKVEARQFVFLEKRIDKMLSLLMVCAIFTLFLIVGLAFQSENVSHQIKYIIKIPLMNFNSIKGQLSILQTI